MHSKGDFALCYELVTHLVGPTIVVVVWFVNCEKGRCVPMFHPHTAHHRESALLFTSVINVEEGKSSFPPITERQKQRRHRIVS